MLPAFLVFTIIIISEFDLECVHLFMFSGRSIINKKSDGSNVKESTDSSTTIEEDDVKGIYSSISLKRTKVALYFDDGGTSSGGCAA